MISDRLSDRLPHRGKASLTFSSLSTILWIVSAVFGAAQSPASTPHPDIPLTELLITRWTVEDGLRSNSLLEVAQSPEGYIWISSFTGLTRFDGRRFEIYDRSRLTDLTTDGFTRLFSDRFGRFWIGTRGDGLLTYDRGQFSSFGGPLPARAAIMDLLIDAQNRIWVGVDDLGAFRYEGERPVPIPYSQVLDVTVADLTEDPDGAVWMATTGKGLTRYLDGAYTTFTTSDGLPDNQIGALLATDSGLWIGTPRGLARLKGQSIEVFPELRDRAILSLLEDEHGSLWFGAAQGLMRLHPITGELEILSSIGDQTLRGVGSLAVDREGSIWLTTYNGGLFQIRTSTFKNLTERDGLDGDVVDTIWEMSPDEIWIGTYTGKVQTLTEGVLTTQVLPEHLRGRVRNIYRDREGGVWIASDGGLMHRNGTRLRLFTEEDGLPSSHIRMTYQDASGQIWVGTGLGVAGLSSNQLDANGPTEEQTFVAEPGELGSRFILSINEDTRGRLIVGARGSLMIRDTDGRVERYSSEHGMPGSVVFSSLVEPSSSDSADIIWLATNGGLARLKNGRIRALDKHHGLPIDSVFDLKLDSLGYLWMSSAIGVIRVPFDSLQAFMEGHLERISPELFDEHDGMVNRECVGARKILQATDGKLWIPTFGGISRVDPLNLPTPPAAPEPVIDLFRVDGRTIDLARPQTSVAPANAGLNAQPPRSFPLEPGPQRIELGFAAPGFVAPTKTKVRYQLEGFDPDWIAAEADHSVSYTSLPPGDYRFRVGVAGSDGKWSDQEATLDFVIQPAIHQTATFFTLSGALGVFGIVWLFRRRMAAVHERNDQLKQRIAQQKQVEREREKLIKQLEAKNHELEQLGYSFSHDLKTPLVSIHGFLGLLEQDTAEGNAQRMREDIEQIRAATDRMNRLLNGLRELSSLSLRNADRRILPFAEVVKEALANLSDSLEERQADIRVADNLPFVVGKKRQLVSALGHLIDNATKFTADGLAPKVEIGTRKDRDETVFYVRDHGIGIDPRHHTSIFGLFNRLDQNREGVGIGLVVAERVIKTHAGRIWVESEGEGRGATFCFTLGLK